MDKKEYIRIKFTNDFVRYSLLQEDGPSAQEIADKLYNVVNLDWIAEDGRQKIQELCDTRLSYDKLKKSGGKFSNNLSSELKFEVKDELVSIFRRHLDQYGISDVAGQAVGKIVQNIEIQSWNYGIGNMQEAVALLVEKLLASARGYGDRYAKPVSDNVLKAKYEQAKKKSLKELIQGNNIDDIMSYRRALVESVTITCKNMLYIKLKDAFNRIAGDEVFKTLQTDFEAKTAYARSLKESLPALEPDESLDKEYNHLIPSDFYYRYVENFTPAMAFQTVILQFFARHEDWVLEHGFLKDGELKVFTNSDNSSLKVLLAELEATLL